MDVPLHKDDISMNLSSEASCNEPTN